MKLIKKMFIKNYQDVDNPKVRFKYGIVAGVLGIISNLFLFCTKIAVGLISHSITIVADAINNLSDAGTSVVTAVGFKISARPADSNHPYGHARFEYITGLIVATIVLAIGVLLGKSSIEKIISPEVVAIGTITYVVLGAAILIKFWQMLLYLNFSKSIKSDALKASAADSRNDIISTIVVLIATIIINIVGNVGVSIDGIFGLLVSVFIFISSIKLVRDMINPLLGESPSKELVDKIKTKILSYKGVLGLHDLMIHNYGENSFFVLVHVEVPSNVDVLVSHDLIDNIERDFMREFNMHLSIHMDPIQTDNKEVMKHKARIVKILQDYNNKLSLHDFRMVFGTSHTNILFDVVVPYEEDVTKNSLEVLLYEKYKKEEQKYFFVISIDKKYD